MDDLALMRSRLRVLFTLDEAGRLATLNEPGAAPAPQVYLGRSAMGDVLAFGPRVTRELAVAIREWAAALAPWRPGEVTGIDRLRALLPGVTWAGPAFRFPAPLIPMMGALQLYPGNAVLLHPELATLGPELRHRRPAFAVFRDGAAVSVCYSARVSGEAAEAGVETAPSFRGQGCALLAVEAWSAAIRGSGKLPFYSTSHDNAASLAVARKLDLVPLGEDIHIS